MVKDSLEVEREDLEADLEVRETEVSKTEAAVTPGADLKKDLTGTDLEKDLTDLTEADPEDHLSPSKTGVEEENQPLDQVCSQ